MDAFERENIEAFNESDLYDDDEDVAAKLYIHPLGSCGSIKKEERNHCDTDIVANLHKCFELITHQKYYSETFLSIIEHTF